MKRIGSLLVKFFASFGLATVLFLLLFLITVIGTFEQVERGLFYVQEEYFESLFAVHNVMGVPVLLPGVYLLMILLGINLVVGGIIRIKRHPSKAGVLIIHTGIIVLLAGSMIQYLYSTDGHITLYENQSASEYLDYYRWEVAIAESKGEGQFEEHIIPGNLFNHLPKGQNQTFVSDALPFDVQIDAFYENALPFPKGPMVQTEQKIIDGVFLQAQEPDKQAESNMAGAYVTLKEKATGKTTEAILWGFPKEPGSPSVPFATTLGDKTYTVDLRKHAYPLPFSIMLDKFTKEEHPRTMIASKYESTVTKTEDGVPQKHDIKMNEPLRHEGITVYQSGWGPPDAPPGAKLYSTLAVRRNPADRAPLYACVIITSGMLLHFSLKLLKHLRAENKRLA
jgi:hypothetical protein